MKTEDTLKIKFSIIYLVLLGGQPTVHTFNFADNKPTGGGGYMFKLEVLNF